MTAEALHAALFARGYLLTARRGEQGWKLVVSPRQGLTPADDAAIRARRDELLALVMSAQFFPSWPQDRPSWPWPAGEGMCVPWPKDVCLWCGRPHNGGPENCPEDA